LSEQGPARAVYETDGPSRIVKASSLTVQLRHRPPRQVRSAVPMSNLVLAALHSVGKANVNEARVAHLRETLAAKDRAARREIFRWHCLEAPAPSVHRGIAAATRAGSEATEAPQASVPSTGSMTRSAALSPLQSIVCALRSVRN
jgi:Family of unknown function (DUF6088)